MGYLCINNLAQFVQDEDVKYIIRTNPELLPYWTILHLMIYVQCQFVLPVQEILCPLCSQEESLCGSQGVWLSCMWSEYMSYYRPFIMQCNAYTVYDNNNVHFFCLILLA